MVRKINLDQWLSKIWLRGLVTGTDYIDRSTNI